MKFAVCAFAVACALSWAGPLFADVSNREIKKILIGDSKTHYEKSKRNIRSKSVARFVELESDIQDEIISRTLY